MASLEELNKVGCKCEMNPDFCKENILESFHRTAQREIPKAVAMLKNTSISEKISVREYIESKVKEVHEKVSEWLKERVPYNFKIESFCSDFWSFKVIIDGNSECFQKDPLLREKVKDEMYDFMRVCEEEILSDEFDGFMIYPEIDNVQKSNEIWPDCYGDDNEKH